MSSDPSPKLDSALLRPAPSHHDHDHIPLTASDISHILSYPPDSLPARPSQLTNERASIPSPSKSTVAVPWKPGSTIHHPHESSGFGRPPVSHPNIIIRSRSPLRRTASLPNPNQNTTTTTTTTQQRVAPKPAAAPPTNPRKHSSVHAQRTSRAVTGPNRSFLRTFIRPRAEVDAELLAAKKPLQPTPKKPTSPAAPPQETTTSKSKPEMKEEYPPRDRAREWNMPLDLDRPSRYSSSSHAPSPRDRALRDYGSDQSQKDTHQNSPTSSYTQKHNTRTSTVPQLPDFGLTLPNSMPLMPKRVLGGGRDTSSATNPDTQPSHLGPSRQPPPPMQGERIETPPPQPPRTRPEPQPYTPERPTSVPWKDNNKSNHVVPYREIAHPPETRGFTSVGPALPPQEAVFQRATGFDVSAYSKDKKRGDDRGGGAWMEPQQTRKEAQIDEKHHAKLPYYIEPGKSLQITDLPAESTNISFWSYYLNKAYGAVNNITMTTAPGLRPFLGNSEALRREAPYEVSGPVIMFTFASTKAAGALCGDRVNREWYIPLKAEHFPSEWHTLQPDSETEHIDEKPSNDSSSTSRSKSKMKKKDEPVTLAQKYDGKLVRICFSELGRKVPQVWRRSLRADLMEKELEQGRRPRPIDDWLAEAAQEAAEEKRRSRKRKSDSVDDSDLEEQSRSPHKSKRERRGDDDRDHARHRRERSRSRDERDRDRATRRRADRLARSRKAAEERDEARNGGMEVQVETQMSPDDLPSALHEAPFNERGNSDRPRRAVRSPERQSERHRKRQRTFEAEQMLGDPWATTPAEANNKAVDFNDDAAGDDDDDGSVFSSGGSETSFITARESVIELGDEVEPMDQVSRTGVTPESERVGTESITLGNGSVDGMATITQVDDEAQGLLDEVMDAIKQSARGSDASVHLQRSESSSRTYGWGREVEVEVARSSARSDRSRNYSRTRRGAMGSPKLADLEPSQRETAQRILNMIQEGSPLLQEHSDGALQLPIPNFDPARTVVLWSIGRNITRQDCTLLLSQYGELESVELRMPPLGHMPPGRMVFAEYRTAQDSDHLLIRRTQPYVYHLAKDVHILKYCSPSVAKHWEAWNGKGVSIARAVKNLYVPESVRREAGPGFYHNRPELAAANKTRQPLGRKQDREESITQKFGKRAGEQSSRRVEESDRPRRWRLDVDQSRPESGYREEERDDYVILARPPGLTGSTNDTTKFDSPASVPRVEASMAAVGLTPNAKPWTSNAIIVQDTPNSASPYDLSLLLSCYGPVKEVSLFRGPQQAFSTTRKCGLVFFESIRAVRKLQGDIFDESADGEWSFLKMQLAHLEGEPARLSKWNSWRGELRVKSGDEWVESSDWKEHWTFLGSTTEFQTFQLPQISHISRSAPIEPASAVLVSNNVVAPPATSEALHPAKALSPSKQRQRENTDAKKSRRVARRGKAPSKKIEHAEDPETDPKPAPGSEVSGPNTPKPIPTFTSTVMSPEPLFEEGPLGGWRERGRARLQLSSEDGDREDMDVDPFALADRRFEERADNSHEVMVINGAASSSRTLGPSPKATPEHPRHLYGSASAPPTPSPQRKLAAAEQYAFPPPRSEQELKEILMKSKDQNGWKRKAGSVPVVGDEDPDAELELEDLRPPKKLRASSDSALALHTSPPLSEPETPTRGSSSGALAHTTPPPMATSGSHGEGDGASRRRIARMPDMRRLPSGPLLGLSETTIGGDDGTPSPRRSRPDSSAFFRDYPAGDDMRVEEEKSNVTDA